eukprot:6097198-Prymnesium_polylepis.1
MTTSSVVFARACARCDIGRNMSHASDRQRYKILRQRFNAAGPGRGGDPNAQLKVLKVCTISRDPGTHPRTATPSWS